MKRPALQSKRVGVLQMAFRAHKVFGSFEKRMPDLGSQIILPLSMTSTAMQFLYHVFTD